jgi:acetolactate synthase-1/3 small subunit
VLDRVASLFRRRNFNIESLHVVRTDRPGVSRMVIECRVDSAGATLLQANLHKLLNVISVRDITLEEAQWPISSTTRTPTST